MRRLWTLFALVMVASFLVLGRLGTRLGAVALVTFIAGLATGHSFRKTPTNN